MRTRHRVSAKKHHHTQPKTRKLQHVCRRVAALQSSSRHQDAFASLAPACLLQVSKSSMQVDCQRFLLSDLKTRKSSGTICQIEIHFASQTSKFLIKYNLLRFQISGGPIIFFTEHYKVLTSFVKENKRY